MVFPCVIVDATFIVGGAARFVRKPTGTVIVNPLAGAGLRGTRVGISSDVRTPPINDPFALPESNSLYWGNVS